MRLVVLHYHDRPGGVRSVIENGLPALARAAGVREVVFAGGSWEDGAWRERIARALHPVPVRAVANPVLGYLSEQASASGHAEVAAALADAIGEAPASVWAHNLSAGKNIRILQVLPEVCRQAGAALWFHHHDWWFDGRWDCWQDWLAAGVGDFGQAVRQTFPAGQGIFHWCINSADAELVAAAGAAGRNAGNPLPEIRAPDPAETARAREWLEAQTGGRPAVLLPARFLRRKNPAEALLLCRRLDPEAVLVITGGPSSARERPAWERFLRDARANRWPVMCGVMDDPDAPSVPALMAAARCVLLCSVQEGFGLAAVEAARAGCPILIRSLEAVAPDLQRAGFSFPGAYAEVPVPPSAYDSAAETARVRNALDRLRSAIPALSQIVDSPPAPLSGAVDFACLSLTAQLEVVSGNTGQPETLPARPVPPEIRESAAGLCAPDAWAWRAVALARKPASPAAASCDPFRLPDLVRRRIARVLRHPLLYLPE